MKILDWIRKVFLIMNEDELKNRTKKFALRILKLIDALPNTVSGRTVAGQLARAGTQSPPIIVPRVGVAQRQNLLLN